MRNGDGKCALAKCDGTGALVCAFEYDVIGDLYGSPEYYICTKVVGKGEQFYGVIDSEGNELVPCDMEYIDIMINGYSLLYKGELVGALSSGGKYIEPQFDELENSDSEYLRGRKGDEWGYVGDDGSFEADEEAEPVEESMPDEVRESMYKNDELKKVATLDVVKRVDCIQERLTRIYDGDEHATRKEIDALYKEYDAIREAYDIFDQVFEKDGKVGLCNVAGKVLVPAMYKDFSETYVYRRYGYVMPVPACNFIDKYALVKCDGKGTPLCGFEYEMIKFMFGSCALYRCWKRWLTSFLQVSWIAMATCLYHVKWMSYMLSPTISLSLRRTASSAVSQWTTSILNLCMTRSRTRMVTFMCARKVSGVT